MGSGIMRALSVPTLAVIGFISSAVAQEVPNPTAVLKDVDKEIWASRTAQYGAELSSSDISKEEAKPNNLPPSFWSKAETAIFARAKSEIAYATFLEIQSRADLDLQRAFLKNAESVMANESELAGTLFGSVLVNAVRTDTRAFPENLSTYLGSKDNFFKQPSQPNRRAFGLLLSVAFPRKGVDPLEEIAKLTALGYRSTGEGLTRIGWSELRSEDRVLFSVGLIAEVYRLREANTEGGADKVNPGELAREAIQVLSNYGFKIKGLNQAEVIKLTADVKELLMSLKGLQSAIRAVKDTLDGTTEEEIQKALAKSFSCLDALAGPIGPKGENEKQKLGESIERIQQILSHSFSGYAALREKNYDIAAVNFNLVVTTANKQWEWGKDSEIKKFFEWVTVALTLAKTEKQDQFNAVIDSISDPISSYRTYRKAGTGKFFWSFKGYVGVAAGREKLPSETSSYGAVFAPFGVELGWSTSRVEKAIGYYGLLFSPIDFGAFTATRLKSTEQTKTPTFRDILAPGVYLTMGLSKNWPVTAGLGYQYAPNRRENAVPGESSSASRMLVFIAVDIPYLSRVH